MLTLSLVRARAEVVRSVFGGKRFPSWVDRRIEQFLMGMGHTKSVPSLAAKPEAMTFINCFYVRLKPIDVVMCPQVWRNLGDLLEQLPSPISAPIQDERRSIEMLTALPPGHCLPLLFAAVDELRVLVPSPGVSVLS